MDLDTVSNQIRLLYAELIDAWNKQDAQKFASTMAEHADVVGFDGSRIKGRAGIEATLGAIFVHHKTPPYIALVREIRFPAPNVAVLTAAVGMVPEQWTDLHADLNAVQTMVAVLHGQSWLIEVFQNTPAAFHGRPELKENLTHELRAAWKKMAKPSVK